MNKNTKADLCTASKLSNLLLAWVGCVGGGLLGGPMLTISMVLEVALAPGPGPAHGVGDKYASPDVLSEQKKFMGDQEGAVEMEENAQGICAPAPT